MADTYSYISTTYGPTSAATNEFPYVTISNAAAATNPDIEIRVSVAGWTYVGSGSLPTEAQLKEAVLLAIERMKAALEVRTISAAGIQLTPA